MKHNRALALAALALMLTSIVRAQESNGREALTHETMWLMKRVGAPVPSPDGKWVVFSVVEPSYDEREQVSDLWIVPSDKSAKPRRLTSNKGGESGVAWSRDSRRIAFSARREGDEASQIYVLNIAEGGEAVRITSLSTGARSPKWSTDGDGLLFSSNVYPGAMDDEANKRIAAERKAMKYKARVYDGFPIRRWDHWLDDMQTHIFVVNPTTRQVKDLLAGTKLAAERGFGGRGTNAGDDLAPIWTATGDAIVFVATTDKHKAAYSDVQTHLYILNVEGGEPVRLTTDQASYSQPSLRPDGKALYAIRTAASDRVYNLDRLAMFPLATFPFEHDKPPLTPRILTSNFDRSVGSYDFSPDNRSIYFLAEEAGNEKLYTVPATGGDVRLAVDMTRGVYTNLTIPHRASSPVALANWESATSPAEIVRINLADQTQTHLTEFNTEQAKKIDWLPLRHFWITSKAGKRIHNMIALPPAFDESKKYPLLTMIHGGPHGMWRDQFFIRWNYHLLAKPGYVVLLTDYTGSTGYGEKFAQDIQGDPFVGPANEINESVDEAIRQFRFIDGTRVAAAGASYGGHLVNWLQATTTRYKCLIGHAGLINLESQWGTSDVIYHRELNNGGPHWEQGSVWKEQNPIEYAKNFRTPILLTVGENDFRVPLNQTLENWSVLQRMQVPSRLIVFPDENHWIQKGENSRFFYSEVHNWLMKYLGR